MAIIKIAKRNPGFFMMSNSAISDSRLTWAARGLLAFLLSKPDDWEVSPNHLVRMGNLGRDGIYTRLRELIQNGYVVRERERDSQGRLIDGVRYTVYEQPVNTPDPENPEQVTPNPCLPDLAEPEQAQPTLAQPDTTNTELSSNTEKPEKPITKKTTTTNTGGGGRDLIFPEKLEPEELDLIRVAVNTCPGGRRQDILDELAGALGHGDVRSPVGFFATLVRAACSGKFTLQRGAGIQAQRRREAERRERERKYSDPPPQPLPAARATHSVTGPRAVSERQRLREALGGGADGQ